MSADPFIRGPIDPQAIFVIRWVAVAGQTAALLFTHSILKFDLPLKALNGSLAQSYCN